MKGLKFLLLTVVFIQWVSVSGQDWANLSRYREDNEKLKLVNEKNRVVFMGNSITEGWGRVSPGFFVNKPYVNRGISGQTTPQMLLRFKADVIDLKPEIVVILAGTNDLAGNTGPSSLEMMMDNMVSMVQLAKVNRIKVILCSVLPAQDYPWRPGEKPDEKIPALNALIKQYAADNRILYVDYFSVMMDESNGLMTEYSEDGVHPNLRGYQVMEPVISQAIIKVRKHW